VPEELCKVEAVQQRLGRIQGLGEMLWVAGGERPRLDDYYSFTAGDL
jgi:hypothetical protein